MSLTLGQALRRLHEAGRIAHWHRDGMQYLTSDGPWRPEPSDLDARWRPKPSESPDLEDAATRGCLLALLREATGDPLVCLLSHSRGWPLQVSWTCATGNPTKGSLGAVGDTEGHALAAALVAVAENLEPPTPEAA